MKKLVMLGVFIFFSLHGAKVKRFKQNHKTRIIHKKVVGQAPDPKAFFQKKKGYDPQSAKKFKGSLCEIEEALVAIRKEMEDFYSHAEGVYSQGGEPDGSVDWQEGICAPFLELKKRRDCLLEEKQELIQQLEQEPMPGD